MKILLLLPILAPFLTAILSLLAWKHRTVQRTMSVIGTSVLLACAATLLIHVRQHGIQAVQIGNWPAPFGITLVADLFSAIMILVTGVTSLAVAVYSLAGMDPRHESFGYYPLLHFLLMGVCGAFITGDIFNLFVWFEVMLIASFVLLGLGGERAQLEGSIKYVTLNLMSSALFLASVGIVYGVAGTLNMADLAAHSSTMKESGLIGGVAMLFLIAFGIKAAIFPLFFWLPASYHTPPAPVSAIFAGLLTKVGVYALIRIFTLLFVHDIHSTHGLIVILAGATMVTGVLGAAAQNHFRRILSFHIISQIGYMILGLGLFTPLALAGSVFYIVHHIIVKTNLFLVSGFVHRLRGAYELKPLGGLLTSRPALSFLFLVPALSLAGIPPLSGFWGKMILARAGLEIDAYIIVAVSLFVGLLTLFSMTKIWSEVFWKNAADPKGFEVPQPPTGGHLLAFLAPIVFLTTLTILIGLFPGPMFSLATRAAEQLLNPEEYIRTVLGEYP
jgi:multicomponent Na+:H+ antiporter subunit D